MLVFDGIIYQLQRRGGISVYFDELFSKLRSRKTSFRLLDYGVRDSNSPKEVLNLTQRVFERYRKVNVPKDGSIFHSTYYRNPVAHSKLKIVVTVHDFMYEKYARWDRKAVHTVQKYSAIRKADAIICVSEQTKNDLINYCDISKDQKIFVIHNGVSDIFKPHNEIVCNESKRPYLLYVGNRAGYKNFILLLSAMEKFKDYDLYVVGGEPVTSKEERFIESRLKGKVKFFRNVSGVQLREFYRNAFCFVCCSLDEGFGIPIAEAMSSGCPVICLDRPIFREVAGENGIFIENDVDDLVQNVFWLENNWLSQKIELAKYDHRFTWDKTHDQTLAVYQQLSGMG